MSPCSRCHIGGMNLSQLDSRAHSEVLRSTTCCFWCEQPQEMLISTNQLIQPKCMKLSFQQDEIKSLLGKWSSCCQAKRSWRPCPILKPLGERDALSTSRLPAAAAAAKSLQSWGTQTQRPGSVIHIRKLRSAEAKKRLPKVTHSELVVYLRLLSLNPHRSAPKHPPTSQKTRKDGNHDETKTQTNQTKIHDHVDRLTGCACLFVIDTDLKIRDSGIRCWFCLFLAGDPSLGFGFFICQIED